MWNDRPICSCRGDRKDQGYSSMVVRKMTVVHADVVLLVAWAVTIIRIVPPYWADFSSFEAR